MKLTFLGTSHGVPEADRRCSCTMIEVSGRYYFVDMGMQVMCELKQRGISPDEIRGVFVTHLHGDHTNGLVQFIDLLNWYYKTAKPRIMLPEYKPFEVIEAWIRANNMKPHEHDFAVIEPGVTYDDGYLKVTAIPTQHVRPSYSYLIEAEGRKVIFTGDLKSPSIDFPEAAFEMHTDLLVCEGAHFTATEYFPVLSRCDTDKVLINHCAPAHEASFVELAAMVKNAPVSVAFDGQEIEF